MNTCKTCIHWRVVDPKKMGVRTPDASVKNCTALPPRADYHWPRTSEEQTCGMHSGNAGAGNTLHGDLYQKVVRDLAAAEAELTAQLKQDAQTLLGEKPEASAAVIKPGELSPELLEAMKAMPPGTILPISKGMTAEEAVLAAARNVPPLPVQAQVADLLTQVETPAAPVNAPRKTRRNG
jgi:hypothetical protein